MGPQHQSDGLKFTCGLKTYNRPVIGILSQEYFGDYKGYANKKSYIAASYVKFVEAAGGRVVPILLDQDDEYYTKLMSNVNGILFPGGGQDLSNSGYARTGKILYEKAIELNNQKEYFPIWGTCLGFELMTVLYKDHNYLTRCNSNDEDVPLNFLHSYEDLKSFKIFKGLTKDMYDIMETENVTINYHNWCLTVENFTIGDFGRDYSVLATNEDKNGLKFISVIEHKEYPFYGVQFHPEKNNFEFVFRKNHKNIPHDEHAILVGQFFANSFMKEARKCPHFYDIKEERSALIYNYTADYTIDYGDFEQTYFFPLK